MSATKECLESLLNETDLTDEHEGRIAVLNPSMQQVAVVKYGYDENGDLTYVESESLIPASKIGFTVYYEPGFVDELGKYYLSFKRKGIASFDCPVSVNDIVFEAHELAKPLECRVPYIRSLIEFSRKMREMRLIEFSRKMREMRGGRMRRNR